MPLCVFLLFPELFHLTYWCSHCRYLNFQYHLSGTGPIPVCNIETMVVRRLADGHKSSSENSNILSVVLVGSSRN